MDYRFAEASKVRDETRKEDALTAEMDAFGAEQEFRQANPRKPFPAALVALRKTADARCRAAGVTAEELQGGRKRFLENWITGLEQMHIRLETMQGIREEREEDNTQIVESLASVEKTWEYVTKVMDDLDNEVADTPNRAARRAKPKLASVK